jgi:hypothetical protein
LENGFARIFGLGLWEIIILTQNSKDINENLVAHSTFQP